MPNGVQITQLHPKGVAAALAAASECPPDWAEKQFDPGVFPYRMHPGIKGLSHGQRCPLGAVVVVTPTGGLVAEVFPGGNTS